MTARNLVVQGRQLDPESAEAHKYLADTYRQLGRLRMKTGNEPHPTASSAPAIESTAYGIAVSYRRNCKQRYTNCLRM